MVAILSSRVASSSEKRWKNSQSDVSQICRSCGQSIKGYVPTSTGLCWSCWDRVNTSALSFHNANHTRQATIVLGGAA